MLPVWVSSDLITGGIVVMQRGLKAKQHALARAPTETLRCA